MPKKKFQVLLDDEHLKLYKRLTDSFLLVDEERKDEILQEIKIKADNGDYQALYLLACDTLQLKKGNHFYQYYKDDKFNPLLNHQSKSINPLLYFERRQRKKDFYRAIKQLEQSAEQFAEAGFLLAEIYRNNLVDKKDYHGEVLEYHSNAHARGHAGSSFICGETFFEDGSKEKYEFINKAAEQNHIPALLLKYQLDTDSIGVEKNSFSGAVALLKAIIALNYEFENENENSILAISLAGQLENKNNYGFLGFVSDSSDKLFYFDNMLPNLANSSSMILVIINDLIFIDDVKLQATFQFHKNKKLAEVIEILKPHLQRPEFVVKVLTQYKVLEPNSEVNQFFAEFLTEYANQLSSSTLINNKLQLSSSIEQVLEHKAGSSNSADDELPKLDRGNNASFGSIWVDGEAMRNEIESDSDEEKAELDLLPAYKI